MIQNSNIYWVKKIKSLHKNTIGALSIVFLFNLYFKFTCKWFTQ